MSTLCILAVYILDDGKDPDKKAWVQKQNDPEMAYTPGHIKTGPEINGKACNLNSTLRALFPLGSEIPLEEVSPVLLNLALHGFLGCTATQHLYTVHSTRQGYDFISHGFLGRTATQHLCAVAKL